MIKRRPQVMDIRPLHHFSTYDRNQLLQTDKSHKDWYNPGQMGNLGDSRGHLPKEQRKKPKYQDKKG